MDVVERVALAICEADRDNVGYEPDTYEPMARAAIIAMKECAENEGEASTVYFLSGALEVE